MAGGQRGAPLEGLRGAVSARSVYVIGGAGTGKSTFMELLLARVGVAQLGPVEELHVQTQTRLGKPLRCALRGQRWPGGVYLGIMRPEFPGTDALVNTTGPVAREWLREGPLPDMVVGEGLLLSSRPFLELLAACTDALVVHLTVPEEERLRRVQGRGHAFDVKWSQQTVTRAANTAQHLRGKGVQVAEGWPLGHAAGHLLGLL